MSAYYEDINFLNEVFDFLFENLRKCYSDSVMISCLITIQSVTKPAFWIGFENENFTGRVTVWASGEANLEVGYLKAQDDYLAKDYDLFSMPAAERKVYLWNEIVNQIEATDKQYTKIDTPVGRVGAFTAGPETTAATSTVQAAENFVRVGIWMSVEELTQMMKTGKVVESRQGEATYIASSANSASYFKEAKIGGVYVELEVPATSLA